MVETDDIERAHVERALELAREAAAAGNNPFGSLLVHEGTVVAEARNTVVTDDDVAAHPELKLARRAGREFEPATPGEMTLYTSTEPCPMCAGGMYHAGLRAVVYSTSAETLGEIAGGGLVLPCSRVFAAADDPVAVIGPVLEAEGRAIHESFW